MDLRRNSAALAAGITFGAGLSLSGMTDPQKVLAFLTISAGWDPALMLVMGSAVSVASVGFALARRRETPLLSNEFHLPARTSVDGRLLIGATLFGVGWGVSGFCPGPAIVAALTADPRGWIFLPAFVLGMLLFELLPSTPATSGPSVASSSS